MRPNKSARCQSVCFGGAALSMDEECLERGVEEFKFSTAHSVGQCNHTEVETCGTRMIGSWAIHGRHHVSKMEAHRAAARSGLTITKFYLNQAHTSVTVSDGGAVTGFWYTVSYH